MDSNGQPRNMWEAFIIILSIYQVIIIPLRISFHSDIFDSPMVRTFESMIDLTFMLDIFINFRTTYMDEISGEEVVDSYLIGMRYVRS